MSVDLRSFTVRASASGASRSVRLNLAPRSRREQTRVARRIHHCGQSRVSPRGSFHLNPLTFRILLFAVCFLVVSYDLSGETKEAVDERSAVDFGPPPAGTWTTIVEPDRSSEAGARLPALRVSYGYPGVITWISSPLWVELAEPGASFDGFVSVPGGYGPAASVRLSKSHRSGCSVFSDSRGRDTLNVTWRDPEGHVLQTRPVPIGQQVQSAWAISVMLRPGATGRLHDQDPKHPLVELDLKLASDNPLWYSGIDNVFIHARDWKTLSPGQRKALRDKSLTVILDPSELPSPELLATLPIRASDRPGRIVPDGTLVPSSTQTIPTAWTWTPAPGARFAGSETCPVWVGSLDDVEVTTLDPVDEPRVRMLPSPAVFIRPRPTVPYSPPKPRNTQTPARSRVLSLLLLAQSAVAAGSIWMLRRRLKAWVLVPGIASLAGGVAFALATHPPESGFEAKRLVVEHDSSRHAFVRGAIWNIDDAVHDLRWPGLAKRVNIEGFGVSDEDVMSCITSNGSMQLVPFGGHSLSYNVWYSETERSRGTTVRPGADGSLEVELGSRLPEGSGQPQPSIVARWTVGSRTCFNSTPIARPGVNAMPCADRLAASEEDPDEIQKDWSNWGSQGNLCEGMDHALILARTGSDLTVKSTCLGDRRAFHAWAMHTVWRIAADQFVLGPLPGQLLPDRAVVLVSCGWSAWQRPESGSAETPTSLTIRGRSGAITIDREKGRRADPKVIAAYDFEPFEEVYALTADEFRSIAEPHGLLTITPAIPVTVRVVDEQ